MAWEVKDEWIDLALGQHRVIHHNRDVLVPDEKTGRPVPVEHHLVNHIKLDACPTCGMKQGETEGLCRDFAKDKENILKALHEHHALIMQYREKHPAVRIGNGPLK